jgi:hypothetical protein
LCTTQFAFNMQQYLLFRMGFFTFCWKMAAGLQLHITSNDGCVVMPFSWHSFLSTFICIYLSQLNMWNPQGSYFIVNRLTFLFPLLSITGNTKANAGGPLRAVMSQRIVGKIRNSTLTYTTQTLNPSLFLYSHTRAVWPYSWYITACYLNNPLFFPNRVVT